MPGGGGGEGWTHAGSPGRTMLRKCPTNAREEWALLELTDVSELFQYELLLACQVWGNPLNLLHQTQTWIIFPNIPHLFLGLSKQKTKNTSSPPCIMAQ